MKKHLYELDLWLSSLLLVGMALLMIYEVIMRYMFQNASAVNTEICSLAFIWFIYLSMSFTTGKRGHITIELADMLFPARWQPFIRLLADGILLVFMVLMTINGVRLLLSVIEFPFVTPVLSIDMTFPYAIIPLGFGLMSFKAWLLILEDWNCLRGGNTNA